MLSSGPFPVPLDAVDPPGSLVYESSVEADVAIAGETDSFTIDLDDGQTLTVLADPDATLQPTIELLDPESTVIGSAAAAAAGEEATLQVVPIDHAGTHTIAIGGALDSTGTSTVQLILNAAVEGEEHGGPANDQPASAQDLDAGFISLGDTPARRAAVLGGTASSADWYRFTLDDGETATLALTAMTPGEFVLELYDHQANRLATGIGASDRAEVISNFLDRTADQAAEAYLVRVSGAEADYSLVVARNADFDPGPDNRFMPDVERFTLSGTVLGSIGPATAAGIPLSGATDVPGTPLSLGFADDGSLAGPTVGAMHQGVEYFAADTSLASYTVAFDGITLSNGAPDQASDFPVNLEDLSTPSRHVVRATATVLPGVEFERRVSWEDGDDFARVTMTLTNHTATALGDVAFLENLDPDPEGILATANDVTAGGELVVGSAGPGAVALGAHDPRAVASAEGYFLTDPFAVIHSPQDPDGAVAEAALNLAFDMGVLSPGQTATAGFVLVFGWDRAEVETTYGRIAGSTVPADLAPITFGVFGDYGMGNQAEENVAQMVKGWEPDFLITTGDNNYGGLDVGSPSWTANIGEDYGSFIQARSDHRYPEQTSPIQRFFPSVGNHDTADFAGSAGAVGGEITGYLDYLHDDPAGGRLPDGVHDSRNSYYDFRWGPIHLFAIDSDHAIVSNASRTAQMEWLEQGLANSTATWKFVYMHYPPFSSGMHGSEVLVQWPFQQWGADAVFCGHDHSYERILRGGLPYLISGAGGGYLYSFGDPLPGSLCRYSANYGSLRVVVDGNLATFEFLSIDDGANGGNGGQLIDTFAIHKSPYHNVEVNAGDALTMETFTPAGGQFEFANRLDPTIELYDPAGTLIAGDDNGAPDGRNARLGHTATVTGTHTVRVRAADDTAGEYVLNVGGQTGTPPAFRVAASDPATWMLVPAVPTQFRVLFNNPVLLSTLDAADLTAGGRPATALSIVDGDTAVFDLPAGLGEGTYAVAIAPGTILDLQGTPIQSFYSLLRIDFPPRVVASSLLEGDMVAAGPLAYTAQFDKELYGGILDATDVEIVGRYGGAYNPTLLNYDYDPVGLSSTLTLEFSELPEDHYTLTLLSGSAAFRDLLGHHLDGEPDPATTVPSGDGMPGGHFSVSFIAVPSRRVEAQPFQRLEALGSLMSLSDGNAGRLEDAELAYDHTLFAQAGQTISAVALPDDPFVTLSIEVPGLAGPVVAAGPGEPAILPPVPVAADGTYAVRISGDLPAGYRLEIGKNLAAEIVDTDDGYELALDDSLIALGPGRFGLRGRSGPEPADLIQNGGFETGDFGGWTRLTNGRSELTPWTVGPAGGGCFGDSSPRSGTYSAYNGFAGEAGLVYRLYQEVTIPADVLSATLTTNHRIAYRGGVAGTQDHLFRIEVWDPGQHWLHEVYEQPLAVNQPGADLGWNTQTFDLLPHAGQTVSIQFFELVPETYAGPAILQLDDVRLTVTPRVLVEPDVDEYTLDLSGKAGRPIDVCLAGQGAADFSAELLELLDTDGTTVLATAAADPLGVAAENFDLAILDFLVPADGVYTLRLTSSVGGDYGIVVTDRLVFDSEPNGQTADPLRELDDAEGALGYLDESPSDADWYSIDLATGDPVRLLTETPFDAWAGSPRNDLDPTLLVLGPDGQVLASDSGSAPDGRNAVLRFVAPQSGTYRVGVTAESGTGEYLLWVNPPAEVAGRYVFYNNSAFDGNNPASGLPDDNAIAPDKQALLPGQTATFANYTGYSRGINGIIVDVVGVIGTPAAEDFEFRVGNDNQPAGWTPVAVAPTITLRENDGAGDSDRITIIWPDNTIQKQWLQVTLLAGGNLGLRNNDVFYFGNAVGESGNSTADAKVNAFDMLGARDNQRTFLEPALIDFPFDYNRDARVNTFDMLTARDNQTHFLNALRLITVPTGGAKAGEPAVVETAADGWHWLHELDQADLPRRLPRKDQRVREAVDALFAAYGG